MRGNCDQSVARRAVIAGLALAVLLLILNVPLPTWLHHSRQMGALLKASHGLLFVGVTCITLWLLGSTSSRSYVQAGLIAGGLAVATELSQFFTSRNPMLTDVLADLLGVTAALAAWAAFSRSRAPMSASRRAALVSTACVSIALILLPLVGPVSSLLERSQRFPILFTAEFSSALSMTESMTDDGDVAISVSNGALRVDLLAGPLPGVVITDFAPDWSNYRTVTFDLENPAPLLLAIEVHLRDFGSSDAYTDRFNARRTLLPGQRALLSFALSDVAAGPQRRAMHLDDMSLIALYRVKPGSQQLVLHSIRLE